MRVARISGPLYFTGGKTKYNIDSHVHSGKWGPENARYTINDILEISEKPLELNIGGEQETNIIKYNFVTNLDALNLENGKPIKDELNGNLDLLKEAAGKDNIKLLAVCQPGYGSAENIEKLLSENPGKFIGLKFHPETLPIAANDPKVEPYMEIAKKYHLPCLFHSGLSGSNSCPRKIYEIAKKFPDVPVILAHLGAGTDHKDAINVMVESINKNDALLYCDTSWVDHKDPNGPALKELIEKLSNTIQGDKTDRILFGTDMPLGEFGAPGHKIKNFYSINMENVKNGLKKNFGQQADELIEKIFYKNAETLYNLSSNNTPPKKSFFNIIAKNKVITGIGIFCTGVGSIFYAKNKSNKSSSNSDTNEKLKTT